MRFSGPVPLVRVALTLGVLAVPAAHAYAQTGTLQVPAQHAPAETPPKPPAAAPRQPVQKVAPPVAAKPHTPPVVQAKGGEHAQKKPPVANPAHKDAPRPAAKTPEPPVAPPVAVPAVVPVPHAKPEGAEKPAPATPKLPLPRFASLRSDEVRLRAGPADRYPIEAIYKRRDLPVEITREFDVWRAVVDADGFKGWVHQAMLTGKRTFIVTDKDATLRGDPKETASPVAILKVGVIGRIRACAAGSDWCQVQASGYRGFLRREQFWGTLKDETIAP